MRGAPSSTRTTPILGRTSFPRVRLSSSMTAHLLSQVCGPSPNAPPSPPDGSGYENPDDGALGPDEDSFSNGNLGSLWGPQRLGTTHRAVELLQGRSGPWSSLFLQHLIPMRMRMKSWPNQSLAQKVCVCEDGHIPEECEWW